MSPSNRLSLCIFAFFMGWTLGQVLDHIRPAIGWPGIVVSACLGALAWSRTAQRTAPKPRTRRLTRRTDNPAFTLTRSLYDWQTEETEKESA